MQYKNGMLYQYLVSYADANVATQDILGSLGATRIDSR